MIWACMSLIQPGEKVGRGDRGSEVRLNGEGKVQEPNTNVVNRLSERIHPPPQKVITYNEQIQASVLNSKRPLIW